MGNLPTMGNYIQMDLGCQGKSTRKLETLFAPRRDEIARFWALCWGQMNSGIFPAREIVRSQGFTDDSPTVGRREGEIEDDFIEGLNYFKGGPP